MASTFVTRLKVGEALVDAKGVSRLVSPRIGIWPLVTFAVAGLSAVVVAVLSRRPPQRDPVARTVARKRARHLIEIARGDLPTTRDRSACRCALHSPLVFDLRYHVASLTAVFVALVIGILVGVGLSGKGFVNDAERTNLNSQIADLRHERDSAKASLDAADRGAQAFDDFADAAYPTVVQRRLDGKKIAILFVGPVDQGVSFAVTRGVRDAGGSVVRTRSISVPFDSKKIQDALKGDPTFRRYLGVDHTSDLGDALAEGADDGGQDAALGRAREDHRPGARGVCDARADAVVVVRSAGPQRSLTKILLAGMYGGFARSGVPAVGTERSGTSPSALPAFALAGLSTVDSVDTAAGRLGLVLLLAGGEPGSYGSVRTPRTACCLRFLRSSQRGERAANRPAARS